MDNKQFDSIEQSAMAVVLCKGKILATVEDIYGRKVLSLPKGHNEQGETLLQTAIRECFEETNIILTERKLGQGISAIFLSIFHAIQQTCAKDNCAIFVRS